MIPPAPYYEPERCPTCGSPVRVVSGGEGTAHYERRYSGVYHVDGPLGQIRQMAEWADREGNRTYPDRETLRKIATNLWAAVDAIQDGAPVHREEGKANG